MNKIIKISSVFCIVLICITIISACGVTMSNEPCTHCGDTPTKAYNTNVDTKSYVCDECSSSCHFCNKRATKSYTNIAKQVNFVCKDCYDEIIERSK